MPEMTPTEACLQTALSAALSEISATVTSVAARTADNFCALAQSSTKISQRDLLQSVQAEMRTNLTHFQRAFDETLCTKIALELAPRPEAPREFAVADWESLTLVDDSEMDERLYSDRIGQQISHTSEVELRALAAHMGSLLNIGCADQNRNPLRAELLGAALYRAIKVFSDQPEARKLLAQELGIGMAQAMPECYARILLDLQARGVRPAALTVRTVEGPGNHLPGVQSGYASLSTLHSRPRDFDIAAAGSGQRLRAETDAPATGAGMTGRSSTPTGSKPGPGTYDVVAASARHSTGFGDPDRAGERQGDVELMALLRRLTAIASRPGELGPTQHSGSAGNAVPSRLNHVVAGDSIPPSDTEYGATQPRALGRNAEPGDLMAVNLIRTHRDELVQASAGKLDHMVIDVVGSLFDQILSDSRVPPQMARQIARLQLPVLRVALNDASFFTSRRHPVRQFVNRIASLACAFDDFDEGPGKPLLIRVSELVQEIIEGDFDQIKLYSAKLAALETFIGEQTLGQAQQQGAASTLNRKESELRLQQRYMVQLQGALAELPLPPYLREFLPQVWSQALMLAASRDGADSDRAQRFRRVGRDLVMSVQPKGTPTLRKQFLMALPPLMKDLCEGLQLIGWPAAAQQDFFGRLLPAQAESLKGQPLSELDHNMLVKQLDTVFNMAVPNADSLSPADPVPEVDSVVMARRFTADEARRVGLVEEAAVDWAVTIDTDVDFEIDVRTGSDASTTAAAVVPPEASRPETLATRTWLTSGGPGPAPDAHFQTSSEAPEPSSGASLIDHIKLGCAYQMHLKDEWQRVRLTHVSAARSFFVFTTGRKHQETISMTARMVTRMCASGRMRAVESAYLMERATQRARKQLAALRASGRP